MILRWCICFAFLFSVVESAAGVVASAKTGAEMIEDSSKYLPFMFNHQVGNFRLAIPRDLLYSCTSNPNLISLFFPF